MIHHPECTEDPCTCEDLDMELVQKETKMTLADMIRAAKDAGTLRPSVQNYVTAPTA